MVAVKSITEPISLNSLSFILKASLIIIDPVSLLISYLNWLNGYLIINVVNENIDEPIVPDIAILYCFLSLPTNNSFLVNESYLSNRIVAWILIFLTVTPILFPSIQLNLIGSPSILFSI